MTAERAVNTGARRRVARLRDTKALVAVAEAQLVALRRAGGDPGKPWIRGRRVPPACARAVVVSLQRGRAGRDVLTSGGSVERRSGAWRGWGQRAGPLWNTPARGRTNLGGGVRAARLAEAQLRKVRAAGVSKEA